MKNLNQTLVTAASVALWILSLFLTYTFAVSCYKMFSGDDQLVAMFNKFGGKALRVTVASLEGLGAVLILLPRTVVLGASALLIAMIGVLTANMSTLGGIPGQPVLMLVLVLILLVGRLNFPATRLITQTE
jgi:hypothetical protein